MFLQSVPWQIKVQLEKISDSLTRAADLTLLKSPTFMFKPFEIPACSWTCPPTRAAPLLPLKPSVYEGGAAA